MESVISYQGLEISLIELIIGAVLFLIGSLLALFINSMMAKGKDVKIQSYLNEMADRQNALQGRLSQFSEDVAQRDALMRDTLDNRLSQVSEKVGKSIVDTQERNSKNLKELHERLGIIDRAQKNIETLSGEVHGLQSLLSNKQARGAFGEKQMQDLIAEYLPPRSYEFQATLSNNKRVDALILLPNGQGNVSVDSKFPLESWRRLMAAENTPAEIEAQRGFIKDVKTHIKAISEKYLIFGETHDVAMMFIPSEAVYAELHANFSDVIEDGFKKKVMIVSPTTFMATLHTMRAVMKDAAMREQAHIIQREVSLITDDITRLDARVSKLQQHFSQSVEDMRQVRISTEKITKRAGLIEGLDVVEETPQTNITELPRAQSRRASGT